MLIERFQPRLKYAKLELLPSLTLKQFIHKSPFLNKNIRNDQNKLVRHECKSNQLHKHQSNFHMK